jgi:tetratricopeptide (TPR) repeat protein
MRKRLLFFLMVFCFVSLVFSQNNTWGNLKKIHLYDSIKNYDKVLENLQLINLDGMNKEETEKVAFELINFGDYYFSEGKHELSKSFYKKVLEISPEFWYVYNKLGKINNKKGNVVFNLEYGFKQSLMILKDFDSSFLILNTFFNVLFFSSIFVFFIFSFILFSRYFQLAGNDLFINKKGMLSIKRVFFVLIILFWPIFIFSGWMVYPFLIIGFLWIYLDAYERKTTFFIFIFILILTFLFSFNHVLENNFKQKSFDIIRNVYKGSLFEKKVYDKFDDELKVIQALSYYKNSQYKTALSILNSTKKSYKSKYKYNLLGNLYFKLGRISDSVESYRKSLIIWGDDKSVINNFTLALLRNNESNRIKTFNSFARLYPKINELKMEELYLKDIKITQKVLWKRVFNGSRKKFEPLSFIKNLFIEFLKSPFIYCMIIFIIYILFTKKIFVSLGQSINCIKCSKIIKNDLGYKFSKMCDECHQLFLIKDIVFLEAKIIKEKELNKKYRRKYLFNLLLSTIIPGLNLNFKERSKVFFIFAACFYFLLGFYIFNRIIFEKVYLTSPIFVHFIGFIALIFYLSINLYSLKGD